ncbi:hypothetical protein MLD38_027546 [Melastoma candidum]|uniref:Uncharacterized protein n=1 Tax=Melastoma candidum TaxID=119954 RepID=A0ACB9P334_9MYRT|nr:hypothetical protein MLD38_027546 [Melastoma candidum]
MDKSLSRDVDHGRVNGLSDVVTGPVVSYKGVVTGFNLEPRTDKWAVTFGCEGVCQSDQRVGRSSRFRSSCELEWHRTFSTVWFVV